MIDTSQLSFSYQGRSFPWIHVVPCAQYHKTRRGTFNPDMRELSLDPEVIGELMAATHLREILRIIGALQMQPQGLQLSVVCE